MNDALGRRVVLMGAFEVRVGGRTVESSAWRLSKAQDLVKVLALSPGRRLHRDQLMEIIWPNRDLASALNNLHQVLHAARRAITSAGGDGHACLCLKAETVTLCPDGKIEVDADEFESAAHGALASCRRTDLERALTLYSGELLPDDRYADWARDRRDALERLRADLMSELASRLEEAGHLAAAAGTLTSLVTEDPVNEKAHRALMRVHALAGDRPAAIRRYQALERTLRQELAVTPDPLTRGTLEAIVSGRMGPIDSADADAGPPTNLDQPLSSFVGRAQELARLADLTREGRLVTLVGAGGCGKTRLAREIGRRGLEHFSGGTYLVELGHVVRAPELAAVALRALATSCGPDETPMQAIVRWIGERRSLLIVDNCEQVVDAAGQLITGLLRACPHLRVLATSREPLRVQGEVVHRVAPLAFPDPRDLPPLAEMVGYDAISLFTERTRAWHEDFELDDRHAADVALICSRLDGLPLALELAAARVPALGVTGVARNLDDRFRILADGPRTAAGRQRTLEATVRWSVDLLSAEERTLFLGLSVFNGPFDLDAVQSSADERVREQAPVLLCRLVERSLVVAHETGGGVQYRLLETIRAYALESLAGAGELDSARDRHARWLQRLIASITRREKASERPRRGWRLGLVHDEVEPAVAHLIATDPRGAAGLAAQLWPYMLGRSTLDEGWALIERVVQSRGYLPTPNLPCDGDLVRFLAPRRASDRHRLDEPG